VRKSQKENPKKGPFFVVSHQTTKQKAFFMNFDNKIRHQNLLVKKSLIFLSFLV